MATNSFQLGMHFFRRFIGNPREVGALWPSSGHLAAEMVRDLAGNLCRCGTQQRIRRAVTRAAGVAS